MDNDNKEQAKESEMFIGHQLFLPNTENIRLFSELAEEELKTAGRFRSPRSEVDRLLVKVRRKMVKIMEPDDLYSFGNPDYPVPTEWQEIFNYLYEEGIIASPYVQFRLFFNDEPKIYSLQLTSTSVSDLTDGYNPKNAGYSRGASNDFKEALSKVVGELLERYPLTLYRTKDFVRASCRSLKQKGKNFLNIFDLAGFADWQKDAFPSRRFDEDTMFSWVKGEELLNERSALIPAQLVFWNYKRDQESQEPYLRESNTNGAAGHFTKEETILAGIYENIQRDAFLIYWLNNIAPPRIDPKTVRDEGLKRMITDCEKYEFEVVFLNTTLDLGVPSCVCTLVDQSGFGPKISIGGGSGPDLEKALMKSITEAMGVYHWLRAGGKPFVLPPDYKPFTQKGIGQEERLMFWENQESFKILKPFLSGSLQSLAETADAYPSSFKNPSEELEYVKEIFRKRGSGYEMYVYEAKHPVLDSLGYHSARIIIPVLVPVYLEETNAALGSTRLWDVPGKMGYNPSDAPNPFPHPFS